MDINKFSQKHSTGISAVIIGVIVNLFIAFGSRNDPPGQVMQFMFLICLFVVVIAYSETMYNYMLDELKRLKIDTDLINPNLSVKSNYIYESIAVLFASFVLVTTSMLLALGLIALLYNWITTAI